MISLIFLTGIGGYAAMIFVTNPHVKEIGVISTIRTALRNIGVEKPAWKTLIISAAQDVKVPAEALWTAWSRLEGWTDWGGSLYESVEWTQGSEWEAGARFKQVVSWGFPVGKKTSIETVEEVVPLTRVRWCKQSGGIKSCHIWSFTYLPNGQVRVSKTEVFHGTTIGLIKPIVASRWQKMFDASVKNLIREARKIQ